MTYNPKLVVTAAPGILGYLYLVLYEASAPGVPVANSGQIAPPHDTSLQIPFNGLNPVVHLGKLFETDGVSTVGTLLANFEIDPAYPGFEIRPDLWLTAGDPGFPEGGNSYVSPTDYLKGWDYDLFVRGMGQLNPADEYGVDGNNNPSIAQLGYQVQPGEKWTIKFIPKAITFNPTANTGGNLFSAVDVIDDDIALTVDDMGKQKLLIGANSTLVVTLPDISTVTANRLLLFDSEGGNHINAVLKAFDPGTGPDHIDFMRHVVDRVILGQTEGCAFYKWIDPNDNTNIRWKLKWPSDTIKLVGEKVYFDKYLDADLVNLVFADGRELDRIVYARLWAYVQSLDPALLVTDTVWLTVDANGDFPSKGKFSQGDGSTTFRIPLLFTPGFIRGVDPDVRKALTFQRMQLLKHRHIQDTSSLDHLNGGSYGHSDSNFQVGTYGGPVSATRGITSRAIGITQRNDTIPIDGDEERPSSTAQYILIRI